MLHELQEFFWSHVAKLTAAPAAAPYLLIVYNINHRAEMAWWNASHFVYHLPGDGGDWNPTACGTYVELIVRMARHFASSIGLGRTLRLRDSVSLLLSLTSK